MPSTDRDRWPVWIKASIATNFKAALVDPQNPSVLFVLEEETLPPVPNQVPRVELRINGPDICDHTAGETSINVEINLLAITAKSDNDLYDHDRLVGKLIKAMATTIFVMETDEDGGPYFGCLQRQGDIYTTRWGEIDKAPELIQSTVEGSYKITL